MCGIGHYEAGVKTSFVVVCAINAGDLNMLILGYMLQNLLDGGNFPLDKRVVSTDI